MKNIGILLLVVGILLFVFWQNSSSKGKKDVKKDVLEVDPSGEDMPYMMVGAGGDKLGKPTELKDGDELISQILSSGATDDLVAESPKEGKKPKKMEEKMEEKMGMKREKMGMKMDVNHEKIGVGHAAGVEMGVESKAGMDGDSAVWMDSGISQEMEATTENTSLGEQKPLAAGPIYWKPYGSMGDKATGSHGLVNKMAATAAPISVCNRFYCYGCGDEDACPHALKGDTDDIRRNYFKLLTDLRAKRTNEYPFYEIKN